MTSSSTLLAQPERHAIGSRECATHLLPLRDTLDILSGKWKIMILLALSFSGKRRFTELQREIAGITPKMLSKELKELEANQLVKREVYATTPVTIEYSLTTWGRSLEEVIDALRTWGVAHRKRITAAVGK